jgi:hypothetical protein
MPIDCDAGLLTECKAELEGDVATDQVRKSVDESLFMTFGIDGFEQPFGGFKIGDQVEETDEPASSPVGLGAWRKSRDVMEQSRSMKRRDHPPLLVIRSSAGEARLVPPGAPLVKVINTFQMQAQRVTTRSLHFRLTGSWQ